ncbi:hypothetical protein N7520_006204 [Penicillium odoratum]|uniref:uncharacterized protein n=1 Tax=Penicillium odoratum TaxID=1167516 RepID=UPI002549B869|nr:uncharacterized protein N7520_006204 [Penicillium odoratum]KAJ5759048.1 hypothetical protein N7520_006204 [Penicillium odoratum]
MGAHCLENGDVITKSPLIDRIFAPGIQMRKTGQILEVDQECRGQQGGARPKLVLNIETVANTTGLENSLARKTVDPIEEIALIL